MDEIIKQEQRLMTRKQFLDEVLDHIGTPFGHQKRLKGVAVDCAGPIINAGKKYGVEFEDLKNYSRKPRTEDIINAFYKSGFYDISKEEVMEGDIGLVAYLGNIQHMVVITRTNPLYICHAVTDKFVAEHRNNLEIARFLRYSKFIGE